MAFPVQFTFSGGEISDEFRARADSNRYYLSLELCENFVTKALGGIYRRYGTELVEVLPTQPNRLELFEFSVEQAYMLRGIALLDRHAHDRVQHALDGVAGAIGAFKAALRDSSWAEDDPVSKEAFVDTWAGGLQGWYDRITEPGCLLTLSLKGQGLVGATGGRPRTGVPESIEALRALGVSKRAARGLLDAAGLTTSRSPKLKPPKDH